MARAFFRGGSFGACIRGVCLMGPVVLTANQALAARQVKQCGVRPLRRELVNGHMVLIR